jgi:hypothetical protein
VDLLDLLLQDHTKTLDGDFATHSTAMLTDWRRSPSTSSR